jgi:hypothetical protein
MTFFISDFIPYKVISKLIQVSTHVVVSEMTEKRELSNNELKSDMICCSYGKAVTPFL